VAGENGAVEQVVASAESVRPLERLFRVIPALDSLRSYSLRSLRLDGQAGLTVAALAVPQPPQPQIAGLPGRDDWYFVGRRAEQSAQRALDPARRPGGQVPR